MTLGFTQASPINDFIIEFSAAFERKNGVLLKSRLETLPSNAIKTENVEKTAPPIIVKAFLSECVIRGHS